METVAISIYFLDHTLSLMFQWLYVQSTCNYYRMVNEIYICSLDQTAQCLCESNTLAANTPWLMRLTLRFIFLITPCPLFLWPCVQDTCNYYDMVNEFVWNLDYFSSSHCPILLGLYTQKTCNYYRWLMRLFNCRFVFVCLFLDHTLPNASAPLYPKHLKLLCHG